MAPINQIFALTALAAFATAVPLKPRQQQDMVTETQWTTVNVPVTLWVDENGTPLSTVASGGNFAVVPTVPSTPTTFSTVTSAPAPSNVVPTVTSTSTAAPVSTQQPISAPAPPSSTAAPYVPPTSAAPTTTPAAAPPASSTVATPSSAQDNLGRQATTAAAAGGSVSASSSNGCTGVGDACVGDITHYDGGLGACGWNVNTNSDMQIALPVGFMGSQSNGNPYCGKSLTIKNPNTGATVSATVGDKCMGCEGRSIDLTNALFNAIGNGCDGRCSGFEWWFN